MNIFFSPLYSQLVSSFHGLNVQNSDSSVSLQSAQGPFGAYTRGSCAFKRNPVYPVDPIKKHQVKVFQTCFSLSSTQTKTFILLACK